MLREYKEVDPDLLPTIIEMARVDSVGRYELANKLASAEAFGVRAVGWTTVVLGVGGLVSAVAFGVLGIESGVIGSLVASALIGLSKVATAVRSKGSDD